VVSATANTVRCLYVAHQEISQGHFQETGYRTQGTLPSQKGEGRVYLNSGGKSAAPENVMQGELTREVGTVGC
jgi:hypothetical protein